MNTNKTPYEFIAPLVSEILQPILPLEYANATSYMEQLTMVCKKVVELIDAENKTPETIYNLVKKMYTEGSLQGIVADIISDICVNVKYPPAGLTPAKGDGKTSDKKAIDDIIAYAKTLAEGALVYFPAGTYLYNGGSGDTLEIPEKVNVVGCGDISILDMGAALIKIASNFSKIYIKSEANCIIAGRYGKYVEYIGRCKTVVTGTSNIVFVTVPGIDITSDYVTFLDDVVCDYNKVYVAATVWGKNSPVPASPKRSNNLVYIGYSEHKDLQDLYIAIHRDFDLITSGDFNVQTYGRLNVKGAFRAAEGYDTSSIDDVESGIITDRQNVRLLSGDYDNPDTDLCQILLNHTTKKVEFSASNGYAFESSKMKETPAKAFLTVPATGPDGKEHNLILSNDNTDNISVCLFNNVGYETDFSIPVPAEYLKTDDVISIELSGWCEDGANYPANLTIGGQKYILGRGDFYTKLVITPLPYESANLKISGFSVDSEASRDGQKIYFYNEQLKVDDTGLIDFIFGHTGSSTQRVIYWSAVAHYN